MTEGENIIAALKIVRRLDLNNSINHEENRVLRRALNYNNPIASWVDNGGKYFCSRCFVDTDLKTPYCFECGSQMEGWDE